MEGEEKCEGRKLGREEILELLIGCGHESTLQQKDLLGEV